MDGLLKGPTGPRGVRSQRSFTCKMLLSHNQFVTKANLNHRLTQGRGAESQAQITGFFVVGCAKVSIRKVQSVQQDDITLPRS